MPEVDRDSEAALMFPASVRLNVAASAACREYVGLYGVTHWVNGLRAARAVWREDGTVSGSAETKGDRTGGVEWCKDLESRLV